MLDIDYRGRIRHSPVESFPELYGAGVDLGRAKINFAFVVSDIGITFSHVILDTVVAVTFKLGMRTCHASGPQNGCQ